MEKVETVLNQQKRSLASTRTVTVTATAAVVVPRDMDRTALLLSCHSGTIYLSLSSASADLQGLQLTASSGILRLSLAEHGALVFGPWSAISPGGNTTMGIAEVSNNAP